MAIGRFCFVAGTGADDVDVKVDVIDMMVDVIMADVVSIKSGWRIVDLASVLFVVVVDVVLPPSKLFLSDIFFRMKSITRR